MIQNSRKAAASTKGSDLVLRWTGTPPYHPQSCADPRSASWVDVLTTDALEAVLPANAQAAFFRVTAQ